MADTAAIVREYERREAEAGGIASADPGAICRDTAAALALPYETVRDALSQHWSTQGAG